MTLRSPFALAAIGLGAVALAACAPTRVSLGDASLHRYGQINESSTTFGVQTGRMVSGNFDVAVDPDGCARGIVGQTPILLCPQELPTDPAAPGERATRWTGHGADFVTRVPRGADTMRVDGNVGSKGLHATLKFFSGLQWDELRKEPELYALAASLCGIDGEPTEN